jgi:hypothetical protein
VVPNLAAQAAPTIRASTRPSQYQVSSANEDSTQIPAFAGCSVRFILRLDRSTGCASDLWTDGETRNVILTVSIENDLHTMAIQQAAVRRGYESFHVVNCDRISGRSSLSWHSHENPHGTVVTSDGSRIAVDQLSVLWLRRFRADQESEGLIASDHQRRLVNNDCRGALAGILGASFRGTWLSSPEATAQAADKIYQLAVAQSAGFRVPRTLVSQSRAEVIDFVGEVGKVIVKPVVGATGPLMFTQYIDEPANIAVESFEVCPAMYQEYIPGRRHIRLNCFGERMFAASIDTDDLDWRLNLNVPIRRWAVPNDVAQLIGLTLGRLGLKMGIIDLKLTPSGEPVWFEVNPQGQFLFLEPLLNEPLTEHFLDYLLSTSAEEVAGRSAVVAAH